MNEYENAVSQKALEREIGIAAAKRQTAPLLRTGWTILLCGWLLPAIPLVGLVGILISAFSGFIIGAVVATRGNASGGIILFFAGFLGSMAVALAWGLIYMLFGIALIH